MRPVTLSQAIERIIAGEPAEKMFPEFLDTFYLESAADQRLAMLTDAPPLTGDAQLDAFAGAAAEYLARQYRLPAIPDWAFEPQRYLERPWHVSSLQTDAMREYLTYASPAEFRSRNIFTEERPLRRARAKVA
jgi:hypothetical protein